MKKKYFKPYIALFLIVFSVFILQGYLSPHAVLSETLIDKSTWKNVEGFLPDPVLEWIKNGEWVINIADHLEFAPDGKLYSHTPSFFKAANKTNNGSYRVDKKGLLIDIETGKPPSHIVGIPFPEIDLKDPQAGCKAIYNKYFYPLSFGNKLLDSIMITRGMNGIEKEMEVHVLEFCNTGLPSCLNVKNKKNIEKYSIAILKKPFDMAGTAVLKWRYLNGKRDLDHVYIPAVRKVRRMSPPQNPDDLFKDDRKVSDCQWTLIGTTVSYAPFHSQKPIEMVPGDKKGEWKTNIKTDSGFGYTNKDWKGAPWCPLNPIWVKRKILIIEAKLKDPKIKHGKQRIWLDAETFLPLYHFVSDLSDNPWKISISISAYLASTDLSFESFGITKAVEVDLNKKNSTIASFMDISQPFVCFVKLDISNFSLSGFQQFCR